MIDFTKIKDKIVNSSSSDKFFLFVCTVIVPTLIIITIMGIRDSIIPCSVQKQNIVNYQYKTIIKVLEEKDVINDTNPFLEIVKISEKEELIKLKKIGDEIYKDNKTTKSEYIYFSTEFLKLYK